MTDLAVIADDLSGAAESAWHVRRRLGPTSVLLHHAGAGTTGDPLSLRRLTIDTHARACDARQAGARARQAAESVASAPVVVQKIDSLLRGHLPEEIDAVRGVLGRTPIIAVANPALGRTVRDGVLHVDGAPLHRTPLWAVEGVAPPRSVAEALGHLDTVGVSARIVQSGAHAVAVELTAIERSGRIPVVDASSTQDLAVVVNAASALWPTQHFVGSAGIVAAVAERVGRDLAGSTGPEVVTGDDDLRDLAPYASMAVVIGSRAPNLQAQLGHLSAHLDRLRRVDPRDLLHDPAAVRAQLAESPVEGLSVVLLDPQAPIEEGRSAQLSAAFVAAVSPVVAAHPVSFVTGGQTARGVLDALGVRRLDVVSEIGRGAVLTTDDTGRAYVTRPGSFGAPDSLAHIATTLLGRALTKEHA